MEFTLAKDWHGEDPTGWHMSEKLNGWRGGWDGELLWSRGRNLLETLDRWASGLGGVIPLDGEIYLGSPNKLGATQSIIQSGRGWERLKFHVFDAPMADGDFEARQAMLRRKKWPAPIVIVRQVVCRNRAHLAEFVEGIFARGGEGAVLRGAGSFYECGRSAEYLRVKRRNWKLFKDRPQLSHGDLYRILTTPHYRNPKAA